MGWINTYTNGKTDPRQMVEDELRDRIRKCERELEKAKQDLENQLQKWREEDFAKREIDKYAINQAEKDAYLVYRQQEASKWVPEDDPEYPTDPDEIANLVEFVRVIRGKDFGHQHSWERYGELKRFNGTEWVEKAGREI